MSAFFSPFLSLSLSGTRSTRIPHPLHPAFARENETHRAAGTASLGTRKNSARGSSNKYFWMAAVLDVHHVRRIVPHKRKIYSNEKTLPSRISCMYVHICALVYVHVRTLSATAVPRTYTYESSANGLKILAPLKCRASTLAGAMRWPE